MNLAELKGQDDVDSHEHLMAALRIADSLWEHSWDGVSFQRRSWSGLWDHSTLQEGALNPSEQANYYLASTEHRCIQHGMASFFWSKLIRNEYLRSKDDELCYRIRAQHKLINKQFLDEYWDVSAKKWRTVSKRQGGGTVSRESASSGAQAAGFDTNTEIPYYRAVDQAIGLLACIDMMEDGYDNGLVGNIIQSTCQSLLSDFGYQDDNSVTYIGLDRNRNLWHDGWVGLALVSCAKKCSHCWPLGSTPLHQVGLLVDRLRNEYEDERGTMWHWTTSKKPGHDHGNVRYCGDNALWYAICREWQQNSNKRYNSFWTFVHNLQSKSNDGLVSVADVYPQVRLHPNTELWLCWLLCQYKRFRSSQCSQSADYFGYFLGYLSNVGHNLSYL